MPSHELFPTLVLPAVSPPAGHSKDARAVMKDLQVGVFDGPVVSKKSESREKSSENGHSSGGGMGMGLIMFLVVALAVAGYFVMGKSS